jgi:hypothetical protein
MGKEPFMKEPLLSRPREQLTVLSQNNPQWNSYTGKGVGENERKCRGKKDWEKCKGK